MGATHDRGSRRPGRQPPSRRAGSDPAILGAVEGGLRTELRPMLVGDIAGEFFVPSYQRGYRWGRDEVIRLLDDIKESRDGKYFLQPVVVKRSDDGKWELVDGQQRLTTLLLIFQYIRRAPARASAEVLDGVRDSPGSAKYLDDPTRSRARTTSTSSTSSGLRVHPGVVRGHEQPDARSEQLLQALSPNPCHVIWYEAPPDVESTTLFTRLNVGRIPLTDAELVKALLLSRAGALSAITRSPRSGTPSSATSASPRSGRS